MVRVAVAVLVLATTALVLAWVVIGWPVLLIGAPLLLGIVLLLAAIRLSRRPLRRLRAHRAARFDPTAAQPGGLMSGFYELPSARSTPHR